MEKIDKIYSFKIFLFSFLFYLFTLAPTVLWGDSAKLSLHVYNLHLPFDLIGGHPLHALMGKLFSYIPVGDFAYRQNLMSAFFGSGTLALLFFIMRNIGIGRSASIIAVISFAISHTFWLISVINETYTLSLFFISSLLLMISLANRDKNRILLICLFGFLLGLSLTNSLLGIFLLPAFFILFDLQKSKRLMMQQIILISVFFVIGSSLWIYIFFRSMRYSTTFSFFGSICGFGGVLHKSNLVPSVQNLLKELVKYTTFLFYQFPFFGFFVGLLGMRDLSCKNKRWFYLTLILLICYIFLGSSYMMQRKFYILSPSYLIFAIYIGFGIDYIFKYLKSKFFSKNYVTFLKISIVLLLALVPLFTYRITPFLLDKFKFEPVKIRILPYRDNLTFYFWPSKRNEYGARRYAEQVLLSVKPNSIILADFTPGEVLRYLQVIDGLRKNVVIRKLDWFIFVGYTKKGISKFIDDIIKDHAIYLADDEPYYEVEYLKEKYDVVKYGILYEVRQR